MKTPATTPFQRAALASACLLSLGLAPAAQAAMVDFAFEGAGNVVVFDPLAGTGGWVGSIDELLEPGQSGPARSFASVVTFSFDALANALTGQFEFTDAMDLTTSVFGTLTGAFTDPMSTLAAGGQLALDYTVTGGTGDLQRSSGFGLSFLTYDTASISFNNYSEQGLLALTVPEPNTLPLALGAVGLLAFARRRPAAPAAA